MRKHVAQLPPWRDAYSRYCYYIIFYFFIIRIEVGSRDPTCPWHLCQQEVGGSSRWVGSCSPALLGSLSGECGFDWDCRTWKPWHRKERTGKCWKKFSRRFLSSGSSSSSSWYDSDKFGPCGAFSSHRIMPGITVWWCSADGPGCI